MSCPQLSVLSTRTVGAKVVMGTGKRAIFNKNMHFVVCLYTYLLLSIRITQFIFFQLVTALQLSSDTTAIVHKRVPKRALSVVV